MYIVAIYMVPCTLAVVGHENSGNPNSQHGSSVNTCKAIKHPICRNIVKLEIVNFL